MISADPEGLYQSMDQPIYDRVTMPVGVDMHGPRLKFELRPLGNPAKLSDGISRVKDYCDTNSQMLGTLGHYMYELWGVAHQLAPAHQKQRFAVRRWWRHHARWGSFEIQVVDKVRLNLPLAGLPLLDDFESPLTMERTDSHHERTERLVFRYWPLRIPIQCYSSFEARIRFTHIPISNPYAFDVTLYLYATKRRPTT